MQHNDKEKVILDDAFWDLSNAPVKKETKKGPQGAPKFDIGTVLLELNKRSGEDSGSGALIKRASEISRPAEKKQSVGYNPSSSLINKVKIDAWPSRYTFYSSFRKSALKIKDENPTPKEHVPFFSYLPQFSQMNGSQFEFYEYFRSCMKRKEFISADLSYILLYIYEIINLPEKYPPAEGLNALCDIWLSYRSKYPKLDRYLGEWVCDYCLINRLCCPFERLSPIINSIIKHSSLKEFYLDANDGKAFFRALYSFESEYSFFNSKYINPRNAALFEKHIPEAFIYACGVISQEDLRFEKKDDSFSESKQIRDAFSAALCAYEIKKKIEVTYLSYSRRSILRPIVTDMVKYAENCLRKKIGVRAKMSTLFLDERMKGAIDRYFEQNLPHFNAKNKNAVKKEEASGYERLYEPEMTGISTESALNIEEKSWEKTNELVAGFESYAAEEDIAEPEQKKEESENDFVKSALSLILARDEEAFSALAEENYMMKETLIECVNEFCYDLLGDIAVVYENGKTCVIADYIEEIKECLKN